MKASTHLVLTLILSILLSAHNALGYPKLKTRASNSYSDTTNMYKHEVRLSTPSRSCTGSIVSNWHILTAAHCVTQVGSKRALAEPIEVTAGITEIGNIDEFQTIRLVETIYTPSHYVNPPENPSNEIFINNVGDIALLKLNYGLGIGLDPRIEVMKLPTMEYEAVGDIASDELTFTGFGIITSKKKYDYHSKSWVPAVSPSYLQFSSAHMLRSSSCPVLGNRKLKMCAKLDNPNAAVCPGDSGGPLFIDGDDGKVVFGVASYTSNECDQGGPAYFTRVFPYVQFLNKTASNRVDKSILVQSYKDNADYQRYLRTHRYRYYWIYVPDVVDENLLPEDNA